MAIGKKKWSFDFGCWGLNRQIAQAGVMFVFIWSGNQLTHITFNVVMPVDFPEGSSKSRLHHARRLADLSCLQTGVVCAWRSCREFHFVDASVAFLSTLWNAAQSLDCLLSSFIWSRMVFKWYEANGYHLPSDFPLKYLASWRTFLRHPPSLSMFSMMAFSTWANEICQNTCVLIRDFRYKLFFDVFDTFRRCSGDGLRWSVHQINPDR